MLGRQIPDINGRNDYAPLISKSVNRQNNLARHTFLMKNF
jgi:hypothetical protein